MGEEIYLMDAISEDPQLSTLFGAMLLATFALCVIVSLIAYAKTVWQKRKTERKRGWQFGDTVYHVAHPTISGKIISGHIDERDYTPTIAVLFDEPVTFSCNPLREKDWYWECSHNLLHPTSEAAMLHSNPELADPDKYIAFVRERLNL